MCACVLGDFSFDQGVAPSQTGGLCGACDDGIEGFISPFFLLLPQCHCWGLCARVDWIFASK